MKACDLEWADRQSQAVCLLWINHEDLAWPVGAESRKPILKEFDLDFFNKSWAQMEVMKVSHTFSSSEASAQVSARKGAYPVSLRQHTVMHRRLK